MDRNKRLGLLGWLRTLSLSARRAWIEMSICECWTALNHLSLSARRAWIEISVLVCSAGLERVALRKESVDRNAEDWLNAGSLSLSLSARRAWIEIFWLRRLCAVQLGRSPQGERG